MSQLHRGFQVKQYRPWKLWLALVFVLVLFWVFFMLGRGYQAFELERLQLERETRLSQIQELEARNHNLVQKNAHLSGSSKIEREAYVLANQNLINLQQQLLAQKEELAFYQGIVAPDDALLGVNLQSFEVNLKNNQGLYNYKMILTKNGKSTNKVRGDTSILVRGEQNGTTSELNLSDISLANAQKGTKFEFRYFQVFEGSMEFPEGFVPYEIEIGINPTTKKVKSFTETISWAKLLSGGV